MQINFTLNLLLCQKSILKINNPFIYSSVTNKKYFPKIFKKVEKILF